MLFLLSAEIIITYIKTKCNPLKRILEGRPVFLIEKGVINQKALSDNRISIDEFIGACRQQGISDVTGLYYAILEQDGKLSLLEKAHAGEEESGIAHALILDGTIQEESARRAGLDKAGIYALAKEWGYPPRDIFLLQKDDAGTVVCVPRAVGHQ
jgi:uncharacterized membrane protein YcaP (DUF421 family)